MVSAKIHGAARYKPAGVGNIHSGPELSSMPADVVI
jgi:hypothetical protein